MWWETSHGSTDPLPHLKISASLVNNTIIPFFSTEPNYVKYTLDITFDDFLSKTFFFLSEPHTMQIIQTLTFL